jgi:hypothetical protein
MSKDNSAPAFPCQADGWTRSDSTGLTMRDYFAAHAHIDIDGYSTEFCEAIVGRALPNYTVDRVANATFWADFRAAMRYIDADAMLRAREA